ncbi:hypothetical protein Tco_0252812 [Tanacetum coccineum]
MVCFSWTINTSKDFIRDIIHDKSFVGTSSQYDQVISPAICKESTVWQMCSIVSSWLEQDKDNRGKDKVDTRGTIEMERLPRPSLESAGILQEIYQGMRKP